MLLHNGKNAQIKNVINKFITNRKITGIQRNFLKRLCIKKAKMAKFAFKRIYTIPYGYYDNSKRKVNFFEKGLSSFVDRTLKKSFDGFRTKYE